MHRTKTDESRIGMYGRKLLVNIKGYNQDLYTELLFSGDLELVGQNETCKARIYDYTQQIAKEQGIDEKLKAHDQMAWVGAMNAIKAQAEEIIMHEIIFE